VAMPSRVPICLSFRVMVYLIGMGCGRAAGIVDPTA
jgi:hypothetical protein